MGNNSGKLTDELVREISQSSGIEEKLVRTQCSTFLQEHPDGKMDKAEFKDMMKLALPTLDIKKMETNLFRMFDTNNDGFISMKEFLLVFHTLNGGTPEANLKGIFRVFDVDSNGSITKTEFKKLVKDMGPIIAMNNPKNYSLEMIAHNALKEMDKDNNGNVTEEEFIKAIMSRNEFSMFLGMNVIKMFVNVTNV